VSGHSKWATIKHQKGAKDKARGKLFAKLIRQVEVAAREGGGDVNSNATLRTMFTKGTTTVPAMGWAVSGGGDWENSGTMTFATIKAAGADRIEAEIKWAAMFGK